MKRIGILTSSRADYGIYLPLLKKLKAEPNFVTELIVFGTHLSQYHGYTCAQIQSDGFEIDHSINSLLIDDSPNGIASSMGLTLTKFADFWDDHADHFDMVFCLGDRYEMFSAVYASTVYGIKLGHIHGGETTLGAIDNIYRHAITIASTFHFTSTEEYANKVKKMTGSREVYNVGALSLENLEEIPLHSKAEMLEKWSIDFNIPTVLITIHPATKDANQNSQFATACTVALAEIAKSFQLVITMPNADTNGTIYRSAFKTLRDSNPNRVKLIESFGTQGYFSALQWSKLVIGNSSSAIIEAASFRKYVVNIGDRQSGRAVSQNVFECNFAADEIVKTVEHVLTVGEYEGGNVYKKEGTADEIIKVLKAKLT